MVHIKNDLLSALDGGNAILLVCLNLSAACNMANHEILLSRFYFTTWYNYMETVLSGFALA